MTLESCIAAADVGVVTSYIELLAIPSLYMAGVFRPLRSMSAGIMNS
jgi:hypothetical protein